MGEQEDSEILSTKSVPLVLVILFVACQRDTYQYPSHASLPEVPILDILCFRLCATSARIGGILLMTENEFIQPFLNHLKMS
jgi:hypothetical protein